MIIITTGLFIFYVTSAFILGLVIMALCYELHLYCKKKRKIMPLYPATIDVMNPIHDINKKSHKENILFNVI